MASFVTSPGTRGIAGRLFGPVISLPAAKNHSATVIMLHGLGDTGNGWASVAPDFGLQSVKWVFPTAPTRPISVNMGMQMPGWFDIDHLDENSFRMMMKGAKVFDPHGIDESIDYVTKLVQAEMDAGIPSERIILGGFSQGGHIALKTALQHPARLAGCLALSTWMEPAPFEIPGDNKKMPIFYGHGTADPLIPSTIAQASLTVLQSKGCTNVEFKLYPNMGHAACPDELQHVKQFLEKTLCEPALTAEEVGAMSSGELKKYLQSKGVGTAGLLEKQELVDKALSML